MVMSATVLSCMPAAATPAGPPIARSYRVEWVDCQHPERAALQAFIAAEFLDTYGARVSHFCNTLVGCRDDNGRWIAALGYSFAGDGKTFLEQYLAAPLETEIAARVGKPVRRASIAEVGNLAARHAGAARHLIVLMTKFLHEQGMTWVAFTATRGLLNSFTRLRLKPAVLADADPRMLADGGASWGSYYASKPHVMFGNIQSGYAQSAE